MCLAVSYFEKEKNNMIVGYFYDALSIIVIVIVVSTCVNLACITPLYYVIYVRMIIFTPDNNVCVFSQEVPKDFLLEGFLEKPRGTKKAGAAGSPVGGGGGKGGGENNDGEGKTGEGAWGEQDAEGKKKPKRRESLLGAKALQYGIVFSTVRCVRMCACLCACVCACLCVCGCVCVYMSCVCCASVCCAYVWPCVVCCRHHSTCAHSCLCS